MSSSTPKRFELWEQRLTEGVQAERLISMALAKAGWWVMPANDTAAYDLATHNSTRLFLIELKDESRYATSKNFCIELLQGPNSKPSGLSISESSVCIHVFGKMCGLYKTQAMRLFLKASARSRRYPVKAFSAADNFNKGILLPIVEVSKELWCDYTELEKLTESHVWRQ